MGIDGRYGGSISGIYHIPYTNTASLVGIDGRCGGSISGIYHIPYTNRT